MIGRDIINIVAIGTRPIEFRLYAQVRELNNRMFLHVLNVTYDHMMIFVMIIDQTMCSMIVNSEMSEDKSLNTSSITLQSQGKKLSCHESISCTYGR